MAKGALAAGYAAQQQGGGGRRGSSNSNVGFADLALKAGEIAERRNIRETTAQKEFTDARNAFSKEQEEMYGAIAYEDQFDDTGITDIDEAGNKLGNVLKSEFEMTKMLYSMGKIDESEVRRRNTRMKGQVKNLKSGVYDKITTFKSELDAKVQAGTDSEADHMKLRQLERMTQNVAFGVDASGNIELRLPPKADDPSKASRVPTSMDSKVVDGKIVMGETKYETIDNTGTGQDSTIRDAQGNKTGVDLSKATVMTMSQFSTGILQNEPGVNLSTITDRLRGLETFGDVYRAGSREYKRYTSPDGKGGRKLGPAQDALMQGAIDGMSQTEKLDALKKIGGDFDDKNLQITDDDVLGYDKQKEAKIDEFLKEGLNNKLMNELRAMESSKPYDDPVAKNKAMRVPLTDTANEKERTTDSDKDSLVKASYPRDGKGIPMDNVLMSESGRNSFINMDAKVASGDFPEGTQATNVTWMKDSVNAESGEIKVQFAYTAKVPRLDANGEIMTAMGSEGQAIPLYETKQMRTNYSPKNMSDFNAILAASGRDVIDFPEWQKVLNARIKSKQQNNKYGGYNNGLNKTED